MHTHLPPVCRHAACPAEREPSNLGSATGLQMPASEFSPPLTTGRLRDLRPSPVVVALTARQRRLSHPIPRGPDGHQKLWSFSLLPTLHDSKKLEKVRSFLHGSFIKSPRAHPDWTPLDHVPITEPITVAEGWHDGMLIGWVCLITVQVLPGLLK